ncbi:hypothetical protein BC938DRAFT_475569 [Jimgerdemannia flammicorona]|uniref:Uncharacterized protein n=1 Tax=Jimgerdemannia flammicorona TaxID=994334 RepID=A0A433PS99_9FUNG|nr:hypothetical protein BC938DRAFT_475569 [Jimgerdemannia flammicorona]
MDSWDMWLGRCEERAAGTVRRGWASPDEDNVISTFDTCIMYSSLLSFSPNPFSIPLFYSFLDPLLLSRSPYSTPFSIPLFYSFLDPLILLLSRSPYSIPPRSNPNLFLSTENENENENLDYNLNDVV